MNKDTARRAARIAAAVRHSELADRERLLLGAYMHFAELHGARSGQRGVAWPTDAELGAHLSVSQPTIRRSRRELERAGVIATERVKPFHKLPSGETSWHGANVVTVRSLAAADAQPELAGAAADVARLERKLERARAKLAAEEIRLRGNLWSRTPALPALYAEAA